MYKANGLSRSCSWECDLHLIHPKHRSARQEIRMLQEAGGKKGHTTIQVLTIRNMIMQRNNSLATQAIFLRRDFPNSLISFFTQHITNRLGGFGT